MHWQSLRQGRADVELWFDPGRLKHLIFLRIQRARRGVWMVIENGLYASPVWSDLAYGKDRVEYRLRCDVVPLDAWNVASRRSRCLCHLYDFCHHLLKPPLLWMRRVLIHLRMTATALELLEHLYTLMPPLILPWMVCCYEIVEAGLYTAILYSISGRYDAGDDHPDDLEIPRGSRLVRMKIQGKEVQLFDISRHPLPPDMVGDTEDENMEVGYAPPYESYFPMTTLGVVAEDVKMQSSKRSSTQMDDSSVRTSTAPLRPCKARGSIRESLRLTPGATAPGLTVSTTARSTDAAKKPKARPKIKAARTAKCKPRPANRGSDAPGASPVDGGVVSTRSGVDNDEHAGVMESRKQELLALQRAAWQRRIALRREAIQAATAKAKATSLVSSTMAAHAPSTAEPNPEPDVPEDTGRADQRCVSVETNASRFGVVLRHGNWLAYHNGVSEGSTDRYAMHREAKRHVRLVKRERSYAYFVLILKRIMDWISGTTYVLEHRGAKVEVVNGFVFQLDRLGMQELGAHFEFMATNALAYHMHLVDALSSEDVMCRLTLLFLWMGDEPGIAPPTRAETSYFLSLFPRPSQMQKEQAEPMDTKDQPKRGTFEDTSTREESLPKAMKGETHNEATSHKEPAGARASASPPPVKVPVMSSPTPPSTTASPANTMTPQHQQLQNAATTTPSGKGKTKKGKPSKGQGKSQKGNNDPSQTTSSSSHQDNVISAMGRLCLRHEDAIAVQRANQGYVWWLRTAGPESIVPSLARVSAAWNRKKDEEGIQDHPLRIVMLSTLLEVMIERAQAAVEPSRLEASAQAGLILNQGDEPFWPFLRWNQARRIEEVVSSEEMRPLEHSRLMRKLNQIRDTINPENILRCHGYHSISENMTGDTWRLLLEIETVGEEAQNLHAWLRRMINCTAWKLIGGRFRRERLGRSPLANRLAELLG
ncbi:unnamed protein product [Symbiodinium microadriaticum]|nr:unnamed protein product [Symbiodinium sp. KB8]CAE7334990.1 unnamed protein product [Symbiodinium microadriaticum]